MALLAVGDVCSLSIGIWSGKPVKAFGRQLSSRFCELDADLRRGLGASGLGLDIEPGADYKVYARFTTVVPGRTEAELKQLYAIENVVGVSHSEIRHWILDFQNLKSKGVTSIHLRPRSQDGKPDTIEHDIDYRPKLPAGTRIYLGGFQGSVKEVEKWVREKHPLNGAEYNCRNANCQHFVALVLRQFRGQLKMTTGKLDEMLEHALFPDGELRPNKFLTPLVAKGLERIVSKKTVAGHHNPSSGSLYP